MDHWLQGRLLLSLLMLGLTTGQADNLRYMVTYPASMSYPSDKDVCVYLLSPDADAELTVSLMTKQTTTNQSVQISKGNEQLQCLSFAVPAPTEGDKDIGTILITIVSGGTQISESNLVEIILEETGMFMQTDKPLYQPGETVRFIFAEFGDDFMTKDGNFARVTLQDSDGNKINQWNDVQPKEGIGELSCPLSPDMPLGDYTIIAEKNNLEKKTIITVDNYILPRMDIELTAPSEVSVLEKSFDMEACGKYTFNKPVKGNITLKLCRYGIFKENICQQFDGVTNTRGCYSVAVNTDTYQFNQNGYDNFMDVDVLLEEDGTGTIVTKKMTIFITTVTVKVTFPDSRSTYKSPIPFRGLMTLTGAGGSPMPNEELELYVNNLRMDDLYTTDEQGVARFTLDTITWQSRTVDIRAHYLSSPPPPDNEEVAPEYVDAYMTLMPYYTNEKSQMKIRNEPAVLLCNEEMNLFADFTLDPSEHTENSLVLYCMVFARGKIAQTSSFTYDLAQNGGLNGFFSFPVSVTSAMTPAATILLYATMSSGDMLSDTIKIPVTSCYPNQVSLQFSETQSLPGSSVSLYISAYPNSVCNIRAVDKSIELLKEEGEQPDETVDEYMKQRDAQGYPEGLEDLQSCPTGSQAVYDDSEESDMYKNLEAASIKAVTNFVIRKPLTCTTPPPSTTVLMSASASEEFADMEARPHAAGSSKAFNNGVDELSNLQSSAEIRKYFPPTWMMQSVMIG
ncbi:alpha-2-macroglobulin-like protein 1 [Hyperolius riggenbachi]|uniref:alpha-2-macroglobulin-like protein 1 n=1 Tax=Hyperolius riggenbachi TaxID=752182 RepID=UPI0035A27B34